jgi:DNA-binding NtrC family response regulator
MPIHAKILIIDDDPDVAIAAQMLLRRRYDEISVVRHPHEVAAILKENLPDLVLLDFNFTTGRTDGAEGLTMLDLLRQQHPQPTVIAITAYADVPLAVEALKRGASDFVTKPWDNARLLNTIDTALARRTCFVGQQTEALSLLMGQSRAMSELRSMISHIAPTEANVMILGENGVGKELVARAIHACSPRNSGEFLAVDMGTIPETTFESEMFGHRKGAFTDARSDRLGRFQAAKAGVLFLDEIGNLALGSQIKLLTALERREITPVGADKPEKIDVRIVSATNLKEISLFDPALFRADLLFRLNTIILRVPALREHAEDIPDLLRHYLHLYAAQYQKPVRQIDADTLLRLAQFAWPGNIRSLKHACERAVILAQADTYHFEDFGLSLVAPTTSTAPMQIVQPVQESAPITHISEISTDNLTHQPESFKLSVLEKSTIHNAIAQANGNISQAAKLLGLSRAALYRKLEKHGL